MFASSHPSPEIIAQHASECVHVYIFICACSFAAFLLFVLRRSLPSSRWAVSPTCGMSRRSFDCCIVVHMHVVCWYKPNIANHNDDTTLVSPYVYMSWLGNIHVCRRRGPTRATSQHSLSRTAMHALFVPQLLLHTESL